MKLIPYNKILRDHFKINIFSFFLYAGASYNRPHPLLTHIHHVLTSSQGPVTCDSHTWMVPHRQTFWLVHICISTYINNKRGETIFACILVWREKAKILFIPNIFRLQEKCFTNFPWERKKKEREREEREEKSFVIL